MSTVGEKFLEKCSGLFQHVEIVLEAYRHFDGLGWFFYDELFPQKLSVYPNLRWGMKDVGLLLNLTLPQKSAFPRQPAPAANVQAAYKRGICYAFNKSQCRRNTSCLYRHKCSS